VDLQKEGVFIKKHIIFILSTYCAYIVYAFYFNGFGTNAKVMMEHYNITETQQGFILTMQSVGALIMGVYLGLHGERFNKIYVAALGILMLGASGIVIGIAPPYILLIFLVMVSGAGFSALDVMLNGMIPELFPNRKNTMLPILHAFFGSGAMISPILITTMVNPDIPATFTRPFMLIGALGVFVFLIFFITGKRTVPETVYADIAEIKKRVSDSPAEIFRTKTAWILLAAGFLYFTFQVGIISWLPTYCQEIGMDFDTSGRMLTAFFAGSLVMRFCGPLILKKMKVCNAYIFFSILSSAAITVAILATAPAVMMTLLVIGGFLQGSAVAFLFLMCAEAFPHRVASASSLVTIAVNLAAMTAPLWMGRIAEFTGFRLPLLLVCASMFLSVLLVMMVRKTVDPQK